LKNRHFVEARPLVALSQDAPVDFLVSGSGPHYIDLRQSRSFVKAHIVKEDGTTLTNNEKTGIINLPLQS